jgi:hypothetical protein
VKHDPHALPIEAPDAFSASLQLIDVTQIPTRGWIAMYVHDCLDSPAPDVKIAMSPDDQGITEYYAVGSDATPSSGAAIFLNVPPGLVTLTATPATLGDASIQITVNVAAGTETAVNAFPTANP